MLRVQVLELQHIPHMLHIDNIYSKLYTKNYISMDYCLAMVVIVSGSTCNVTSTPSNTVI